MEYVDGISLEERFTRGPLPPVDAARLVESLSYALHAVHQQGIVHRDLKPANILLASDNDPKVADFGLAKRLGAASSIAAGGAIIGTVLYMSPEQALGQTAVVGPPADVYALGVILYEALAGRPPFAGATWLETLQQLREREPPPLRPRGVPLDLELICLKCLEKEPGLRFPTAAHLAEELGRWRRGEPIHTRRRPWYERVWSAARRHPLRSAAVLLMLVLLAAVPIIRHVTDPDRPVEALESRLAAGQSVTLVPEQGRPAWCRMAAGAETSQASLAPDGTFAVHSWGLCLLELMRDPQRDGIRIRAEIRHEDSKQPGEVGVFFGLQELPVAQGNVLSFGHLAFDDIDSVEELWRRLPIPEADRPPPPEGNPVQFRPFLYGRRPDGSVREQRLNGSPSTCFFQPTGLHGNPKRWRPIVVEIGPETLRGYWEGNTPAGESNRTDWDRQLQSQLDDDFLPHGKQPPGLARRGALGLYVSRSTASFRRVVVEPLGNELTSTQGESKRVSKDHPVSRGDGVNPKP
jgi:serine/threonine-protein kinase